MKKSLKKYRYLLLLVLILSLSGLVSCSSDDNISLDTLPPVTTIGANTAGCYIDGKLLIPKDGINSTSGFTSYGLSYVVGVNYNNSSGNDYFNLRIVNLQDREKSYLIYLQINSLTSGEGDYTIEQSNGDLFMDAPDYPTMFVREGINNTATKTFYSSNNSGIITIKRFDFINRIISGTFNCTLYNKDNPSETIEITEGRFDINTSTLNN